MDGVVRELTGDGGFKEGGEGHVNGVVRWKEACGGLGRVECLTQSALSCLSWRSGKRPRLRARRVKVRFSLRAIILSLENLNVIIRAIN